MDPREFEDLVKIVDKSIANPIFILEFYFWITPMHDNICILLSFIHN